MAALLNARRGWRHNKTRRLLECVRRVRCARILQDGGGGLAFDAALAAVSSSSSSSSGGGGGGGGGP